MPPSPPCLPSVIRPARPQCTREKAGHAEYSKTPPSPPVLRAPPCTSSRTINPSQVSRKSGRGGPDAQAAVLETAPRSPVQAQGCPLTLRVAIAGKPTKPRMSSRKMNRPAGRRRDRPPIRVAQGNGRYLFKRVCRTPREPQRSYASANGHGASPVPPSKPHQSPTACQPGLASQASPESATRQARRRDLMPEGLHEKLLQKEGGPGDRKRSAAGAALRPPARRDLLHELVRQTCAV